MRECGDAAVARLPQIGIQEQECSQELRWRLIFNRLPLLPLPAGAQLALAHFSHRTVAEQDFDGELEAAGRVDRETFSAQVSDHLPAGAVCRGRSRQSLPHRHFEPTWPTETKTCHRVQRVSCDQERGPRDRR